MNCAMAACRLDWIELRLTDSYSVYLFYYRICAMNNANATVSSPQTIFENDDIKTLPKWHFCLHSITMQGHRLAATSESFCAAVVGCLRLQTWHMHADGIGDKLYLVSGRTTG